jgi:hypothetical protein
VDQGYQGAGRSNENLRSLIYSAWFVQLSGELMVKSQDGMERTFLSRATPSDSISHES